MTSFLLSPSDPNLLDTIRIHLTGKGRKLRFEKSDHKSFWPRITQAVLSLAPLGKYTIEIWPDTIAVTNGTKKKTVKKSKKKKSSKAGDAPKKRIGKPKAKKAKK
jgi:hypothetical protein